MGRVLCGLLKPDSGEAILDGIRSTAPVRRRNLQNKLSVVFKTHHLRQSPLPGQRHHRRGPDRQERREGRLGERRKWPPFWNWWDSLLICGQISPRALRRPASAGVHRQGSGLKPEVILFDERSPSLDAHTQVQVMDLLRELKENWD